MLTTENSGRFLWINWHKFRQQARENEFTPEVFSDIEKQRYDLDEENAQNTSPARITGSQNEESYIEEPYDSRRDKYNARTDNPRRM